MKKNSRNEAIELLEQLKRSVKKTAAPDAEQSAAKVILAAASEVKMEFVRHVVDVYAKLAARKASDTDPMAKQWFHRGEVPTAAERVAEKLLRKQLPFTDEMLSEIFEKIADMSFVTFAPALKQIVQVLERRAAEGPLPPRLRKSAARTANELMVRDWPNDFAREWGLPRAIDKKLAGRIEGLLAGPLNLKDGAGKKKS